MPEVIVTKWGNSLGVRIPSSVAKEAGLHQDQRVRVVAEKDGSVVIKPAPGRIPGLDELLARFDPIRHGGEAMALEPVGKEVF